METSSTSPVSVVNPVTAEISLGLDDLIRIDNQKEKGNTNHERRQQYQNRPRGHQHHRFHEGRITHRRAPKQYNQNTSHYKQYQPRNEEHRHAQGYKRNYREYRGDQGRQDNYRPTKRFHQNTTYKPKNQEHNTEDQDYRNHKTEKNQKKQKNYRNAKYDTNDRQNRNDRHDRNDRNDRNDKVEHHEKHEKKTHRNYSNEEQDKKQSFRKSSRTEEKDKKRTKSRSMDNVKRRSVSNSFEKKSKYESKKSELLRKMKVVRGENECEYQLFIMGFDSGVSIIDILNLTRDKAVSSVKTELKQKQAIDAKSHTDIEVTINFLHKAHADAFIRENSNITYQGRYLTFQFRKN